MLCKIGGMKRMHRGIHFVEHSFAQYLKGDFDFAKIWSLTTTIHWHFIFGAGIAIPYGNATMLPFENAYSPRR